ncbi:MAG: hypothetical protein RIQ92_670 [Actinomycetota bacterium]|jgi:hypothetical protein
MIVGATIFLVFCGLIAILLFSYEKPSKKNKKITGRGGDFAE